ncbi:MAG: FAD-linked oxidase C-terminal domain-containing protein [Dehalococcoidia bacterium]
MSVATLPIRELQAIVGKGNVIYRPEDLIVYEYDGTIDRGYPSVVVLPDSAAEIAAIVRVARRYDLPVIPRGAGTGLSGGALATEGGVVIVTSRMRRIVQVDPENRLAVVEPGLVNLDLSRAVARYGLYYAPDPSSQKACTIGGNVAENSGGPHCLAYGVTTNHVLGLELVLADGEIVRVGGWGREQPGYDLTGVLVGSEGTLAIVTQVCVRLLPKNESVRTLLAIFDTVAEASETVSAIIADGLVPAALEMIDNPTIQAVEPAFNTGIPLDAGAALLIEVDGLLEFVREAAGMVRAICLEHGARQVREAEDEADRERLWAARKLAIGALGRLAPNYYLLDGVVPRSKLPRVLDEVIAIGARYGFTVANMFHAGDGNLHPTVLFDERVPGATARVLDAGGEILRLCVAAGGSITGEHGIGLEKRDYMGLIFSESDMAAMSRLKGVFRAGQRFNPCKAFPTSKGCGEVKQGPAMRALGPDAYI